MRKYRSWKQEKEKNAYLIEIEDILLFSSQGCIIGKRRKRGEKASVQLPNRSRNDEKKRAEKSGN